ncbi:glycosyl hydrolase family 61-domain-containing protein [Microdochium trichocladiopsis]|uniref:lytic cellulose monooxygenase (C4-dehydrogenating) n=1 Tax=Microdochium trichocladiopsis TaxID=1682393 RepID=A0A9P8Y4L1_9PEZI|nr:glycosyl hydrolase family 61-domain-containing protein [Microdochium trichocladiopsis]KAH7027515.1 glycosyl hydrolase family 61-domain-containing protein [Microdochium trichocladiopsis]
MTKSFATLAAATALLFSAAEAHNAFTTLWVNGKSQGDATCVRTTHRRNAPNSPVVDFSGNDIVCGVNGLEPVAYSCAAPQGATLTFEYRISPDKAGSGFIDPGHKGPAAVYAKKLSSSQDSGAGDGWFKIWSEGYDAEKDLWATEKLIKENGFLSIDIPQGLPAGDYLFRPEVVAMHNVTPEVEPQFYVGCAQVFLESSISAEISIPDEYRVSMPGYIKRGDASMTYNIYKDEEYANPKKPYPEAGPKAWAPPVPQTVGSSNVIKQTKGAVPDTCLLVNGNWCGVATPSYENDLQACWASQDNCWKQATACWDSAPITGGANCELWSKKCTAHGEACKAGSASGPPAFKFDLPVRATPNFAPPKNAGSAAVVPVAPVPVAESYPTYPVVAPVITPTATATVTLTDAPLAPLYPSTLLTTFSVDPVPTGIYVSAPPPGPTTTTTIVLAAPLPPDASTFPVLDLSIGPNGNVVIFPTSTSTIASTGAVQVTAAPTPTTAPQVPGCTSKPHKKRGHKRRSHGQHKRRHTQ